MKKNIDFFDPFTGEAPLNNVILRNKSCVLQCENVSSINFWRLFIKEKHGLWIYNKFKSKYWWQMHDLFEIEFLTSKLKFIYNTLTEIHVRVV